MSSFFNRRQLQHFFDISMTLLFGGLLTDQHTFSKCLGCKDDSESLKIVTLGTPFLLVMVKRSSEKGNRKKRVASVHYCDRKQFI